jgi:beta-fructofuranosidase
MLQIKHDPQRPRAHFTPQINLMYDPKGLIHWRENYHLFYQYNPNRAAWGDIHWGHAVSRDLVHWKYLPVALAPSPDGADAGGCFSGCAVQNGAEVALLYTGVYPEVQCLAVSRSADLTKWQKHPTAVIPAPPDGLVQEGFRDPCVWREGAEWRMAIGSGVCGIGGAVLLYRSMDLKQWEYLGILYQGDLQLREPLWTGTMWECPSFFPLGEKWVLVVSACSAEGAAYTLYFTGEYRADHFIPDGGPRLLDFGAAGCFYAPQTFLDGKGRRLMIGWLREGRSGEAQLEAGWSGAMSLPRVLTLGADGTLCCAPVEETKRLRGTERAWNAGQPCGGPVEMVLELTPGNAWCGVRLAASETAPERIEIGYDPQTGSVVVDCSAVGGTVSRCPYPLSGTTLKLHVFVDGSVIEVFVDDRLPIATRFYAENPATLRVWRVGSVAIRMWTFSG